MPLIYAVVIFEKTTQIVSGVTEGLALILQNVTAMTNGIICEPQVDCLYKWKIVVGCW